MTQFITGLDRDQVAWYQKKERPSRSFFDCTQSPDLAALLWTFAGVLFAAGGCATLKAAFLAVWGRKSHTIRGHRAWGRFAVGFGSDFGCHLGSSS
jgi:hypothetical protein